MIVIRPRINCKSCGRDHATRMIVIRPRIICKSCGRDRVTSIRVVLGSAVTEVLSEKKSNANKNGMSDTGRRHEC